ncbi:MAG: hypothetical protein WKF37_18215 [Bryobacteraceae bacterium]
MRLVKQYRSTHNGVTHFVYRQEIDGVEIAGSDYTVNIDSEGEVISAGGKLIKPATAAAPSAESGAIALRAALHSLKPDSAVSSYLPQSRLKGDKYIKFQRGGIAEEIEGKSLWYPVGKELRAAWAFYVRDGSQVHKVIVDDITQSILFQTGLTKFQSQPRGLVFERGSPQPNPRPGTLLQATPPYVERTLQPFTGDPVASPGWVDDTETAGNNVIAGHNTLGERQLLTPIRAIAPDRNFSFPCSSARARRLRLPSRKRPSLISFTG